MRLNILPTLLAMLALCAQCGCMFSPYGAYSRNYYGASPYGAPGGYGGYGGYGTPTYMGTPTQTLTPGPQYYPGMVAPGTIQPSNPSTFGPSNGVSPLQPLDGASGENRPVPIPENNSIYFGSPQTYNSTAGTSTKTTMNDLQAVESESGLAPIGGMRDVREQIAGFAEPVPGTASLAAEPPGTLPDAVGASPMGSDAYFPEPTAAAAPLPAVPETQFEAPVPASANPFPTLQNLDAAPATPPDQSPASAPAQSEFTDPFSSDYKVQKPVPFAHDRQYRWLKGIVTREQNGTWSIIYSDKPHPQDQLVGHVTLAPSPLLGQLQDGDVVQVAGQVDPVARDRQGKSLYLVSTVKRIR